MVFGAVVKWLAEIKWLQVHIQARDAKWIISHLFHLKLFISFKIVSFQKTKLCKENRGNKEKTPILD